MIGQIVNISNEEAIAEVALKVGDIFYNLMYEENNGK